MIYGIFHKGSGLGNQLHRYVATRVLALDKGYEFGMVNVPAFKGSSFMNLDMGKESNMLFTVEEPEGRTRPFRPEVTSPRVWEEWGKFTYDPDFNFIEDNTMIDGSFEDPRYFEHRMDEITKWLETQSEPRYLNADRCAIGFRGGEYYTVPELGLPREYFDRAIKKMLEINPNMTFEIHTDDPEMARGMFWSRDFHPEVIHDISNNWRTMRGAKYAIIANSSFYVLPRLLKHHNAEGAITIAPRYWNRYNTKKWDYPQNYYKQFTHI